jgi:hypothetical protein
MYGVLGNSRVFSSDMRHLVSADSQISVRHRFGVTPNNELKVNCQGIAAIVFVSSPGIAKEIIDYDISCEKK